MRAHLRVGQIELDQVVVTVPTLVGERVPVWAASAKVEVEPVAVRGGFAAAQHVPKRPKVAPDMVKHAVQHEADTVLPRRRGKVSKRVMGAQAAVNCKIIRRVVPVRARLKHGA